MSATRRGHRARRGRRPTGWAPRTTGRPPLARRARHRPDQPLRRRAVPGPAGRRGARVRRRPSTCPSRLMPQTDHMTRLALAAADWALADAGVDPADAARVRHGRGHRQLVGRLRVRPARAAEPLEQGQRARQRLPVVRLVLRGQHRPDLDPARHARAERGAGHRAGRRPRRGRRRPGARSARACRLVVTGGVDASLCPWGWVAQLASGRLSTRRRPGTRAYLPFDASASRLRAGRGRRDPGRRRTTRRRPARGRRSTARSPATRATFDPGPAQRPAAGPAPGRRAARWPTPGSTPADIDVVFADAAGVAGAGPRRGRGDHRGLRARAACR